MNYDLALLHERLDQMPMLRLLAPFVAGIVAAEYSTLPLWFLAGAFSVCGIIALLLRSPAALFTLLFVAGFGAGELHTPRRSVPQQVECLWEIDIDGIPSSREHYTTANAIVTAWRNPADGSWHPADDRIIVRSDSRTPLSGGERLCCTATLHPLRGPESYRRLMIRRGYAGVLYLSQRRILERREARHIGLHRSAAERLRKAGFKNDAGAVVRAMTVADRSGIAPELRTAYAHSGTSHLLAVSGLHTGIVFLVVNLALHLLTLLRRGHLLRNLLAVVVVWLYVTATGFPPSAVRAAVMCTLLQGALASGSEYVGMNALAAAAFGMLLWHPAWIGDIGFQLSFVAVAAILAWGVPLCRQLRTGYKLPDAAIGALCIGLCASAATAPLVSHTFGIVPVAGVLLNPIVIPLAGVVVTGGIMVLLLPVSAFALRPIAEGAAEALNTLARLTASTPCSTVEYTLSDRATAAIYLLFILLTAAAWCRKPKKSVHLPS